METVRVSKKYQVVIPEKLREEAGIHAGDRMMAILKNGILQYVPVRPLRETKDMIRGLDTRNLRDETDRMQDLDQHRQHPFKKVFRTVNRVVWSLFDDFQILQRDPACRVGHVCDPGPAALHVLNPYNPALHHCNFTCHVALLGDRSLTVYLDTLLRDPATLPTLAFTEHRSRPFIVPSLHDPQTVAHAHGQRIRVLWLVACNYQRHRSRIDLLLQRDHEISGPGAFKLRSIIRACLSETLDVFSYLAKLSLFDSWGIMFTVSR